ncbi:MAG: phytanoyl-CoA dioxygenase [Rhodospirillaceae bacterium]|nr:phytanoyl-CoA dioxygenase [Rhodospirillaceae bacterium]
MAGLSADQVAFYQENGYLVLHNALPSETVARYGEIVDEWTASAVGVEASDNFYDLEDSHTPDAPRVRRFKWPVRNHPEFDALARSEKVIDILTPLIGPAMRLCPAENKINIKAPKYGAAVEWHQDWAFYPHTNDDLLAIGIALDDCEEVNGPLMVIPGSHKRPIYDHHAGDFFCGAIDPDASGIDFSKAVALTGKRGTMTIHHARTLHGSALNTSEMPRRLLLIMYAAADAWPLLGVSDIAEFNSDLVSGTPTLTPRMTDVPVRIPLPSSPKDGSIYERQSFLENRYFDVFGKTDGQAAAE